MSDDVQAKIAAVWNSMLKYQLRAQGVTLDTWDREAAAYRLKRQA